MKNETAMIDPDDRDGQTCTKCGVGYYTETSLHDDWDGVLHCNNKKCNHEVKRYRSDDNPEPVIEKAKLSPAAKAVMNACVDAPIHINWTTRFTAAAVLRAAADIVDDREASRQLDAIAYELEAQ